MINDPTPERSVVQRIIKKRWIRVFPVLIFSVLPRVIRHKLERWLTDNGARNSQIKEVRLSHILKLSLLNMDAMAAHR